MCQLQLGHSASYQGCPAYQKCKEKHAMLAQKAKYLANRTRTQVQDSINAFTNTNISFADIARNPPNRQNPTISNHNPINKVANACSNELDPKPNNISDFLNEAKNLFNISLTDLLYKIRQFWPNYQKLQSKEEKMFAYLEFVASIAV